MNDEAIEVDASSFRLVSTPASKYAHAPASFIGRNSSWWGPAACYQSLKSYDEYDATHDRFADGKPPCPRCVKAVEWHIRWTEAFLASYRLVPVSPKENR